MRTEVVRNTPWIDDPDYLSPWLEPTYIPGPDVIFFGADPAWSPSLERSPSDGERCPRCGSEGRWVLFVPIAPHRPDRSLIDLAGAEWVFQRGRVRNGEDVACGACLRWGLDGRLTERLIQEYGRRGTIEPMLRPA